MEQKYSVVERLFARHFKRLEKLLIQRMTRSKIRDDIKGLVLATVSKSYDFLLDDVFDNQDRLFDDWKGK